MKNNANTTPVIISGNRFDARKEAADFIGVDPVTIRNRIKHKTKWKDYSYA